MQNKLLTETNAQIEAIFDEANGDLALGDLDLAAKKYRQCVELDSRYAEGWHALAMVLSKIGDHPAAITAAQRNVELCPNDQLAWSSLSICFVKNGQIKEAESAGAKARILSWGGKIKPQETQES